MICKSTLGEFLTFKNGKTSPERCEDNEIPVYGSNGVIGYAQESNNPKNTIVIGRVGSYCGCIHYSHKNCWVSDNAIACHAKNPDESLFWKHYLIFLNLNNHKGGSGQPLLNQTTLNAIEATVPESSTQRVLIGKMLELFDSKIAANTAMNQTLEKIAQRIFKSWFIDFDPVKANFEGVPFNGLSPEIQALFPREFEESALGMIPKGWAINEISKCVDVGIGKTPPRNQHEWFELNKNSTNKKWFSIKDMGNNGLFAINSSEFLTDSSIEKFNIRLIPENAVILSFKLTLGRVSITTETCCTNEAIAHFVTDSSTSPITSEFLYFYLKNFNYGLLGSTSSIATAVNSKIIKAIPIFEASKEVMCKFTEVVSPFFEKIRMNSLQNNTLENIRSRILPRLLSGQVSLSDANQELKETV